VSHLIYCYAECHYAECRYAECCGAEQLTQDPDFSPATGTGREKKAQGGELMLQKSKNQKHLFT
jgi:hypothetical protein